MKILLFTDVHWAQNSSIIRQMSNKYSLRLEQLIKSLNWVNECAIKFNCSLMICAGDFFDKNFCSDMELTAIKEINWNQLPCYFLCGNHESSVADLRYNVTKSLESNNHIIISQPTSLDGAEYQLCFLPYILEDNKKSLIEYFSTKPITKRRIIISHNDILNAVYGNFVSKLGFSIEDIESHCDLFLNGHIHNMGWVTPKILNLGSFTAHNFTNDSEKYQYGVWILDTETLEMKFVENPYAFNFYKFDIDVEADINKLDIIKNNAVLSLRCEQSLLPQLKQHLAELKDKIVESRTVAYRTIKATEGDEETTTLATTDHIALFEKFAMEQIEDKVITKEELGILRTLGGMD